MFNAILTKPIEFISFDNQLVLIEEDTIITIVNGDATFAGHNFEVYPEEYIKINCPIVSNVTH